MPPFMPPISHDFKGTLGLPATTFRGSLGNLKESSVNMKQQLHRSIITMTAALPVYHCMCASLPQ